MISFSRDDLSRLRSLPLVNMVKGLASGSIHHFDWIAGFPKTFGDSPDKMSGAPEVFHRKHFRLFHFKAKNDWRA